MGVQERKAREFKQREDDILETAYNLFLEQNPAVVTMETIAKHTEIGRGTLYLHFKSKDDILGRLILDRYEKLQTKLESIDRTQVPLDQLRAATRTYLDHCLADPGAYRVEKRCESGINSENLNPELRGMLGELRKKRVTLLEEIFRKAIDKDQLENIPPVLQMSVGWGMLKGAVDVVADGRFQDAIQDIEEYRELVLRVLLKGFLTPGGKEPEKD